MSLHHFTSVPDEMRNFLSDWTLTQPGPKRDAALCHYLKAESAQRLGDLAACLQALGAAQAALH